MRRTQATSSRTSPPRSSARPSNASPAAVPTNLSPAPSTPRAKSSSASSKFDEAAKRFARAADRWPESTLEEDALFWLGESYFYADKYPDAQDAYDTLLKKYSYTKYLDKTVARLFKIGQYWEKLQQADPSYLIQPNLTDEKRPLFDTVGNARKAYESVRLYDPTGPLADDAVMAEATSFFLAGRWEDAAYHYSVLRKEYASSPHVLDAHLLELACRQKIYQGPLYDGAPLEDANEIVDTLLVQFRTQLGDKQPMILETKNKLVEMQAERDLVIAQFYEKKRCFGAARFYYEDLIQQYPQTAVAEAARRRVVEIRDYPAEPPNYFGWLEEALERED